MKRFALEGRKLIWINHTKIAPQNELRVCSDRDMLLTHFMFLLFYRSIFRPFRARRRG